MLDLSLNTRLQQEQRLTPQQLQTLKYLQLPALDLEALLKQKIMENPVVELTSSMEILAGDILGDAQDAGNRADNDDDHRDSSEWTSDDEARRNHFLNSLTSEESFQDDLQQQLNEIPALRNAQGETNQLYDVCQEVLNNLDDNGYLCATDEEIAAGAGVTVDMAIQAVKIVQSLSPAGIGGRDLREILLLQLERNREKGSIAWDIVNNHLEDLSRNRIPQIAKTLDLDIDEVQQAVEHIRALDPKPGAALSNKAAQIIVPEVTVERNRKGKLEMHTEDAAFPSVAIIEEYEKMAKDKTLSKEDQQFFNKSLEEGHQLINSLDYRKNTIEKIAEAILFYQKDFFENGPASLKPLLMSTIAEKLKIHEATVSRAVANKYMQTPYGLFPFRHFFTQGVSTEEGNDISSANVSAKIVALVKDEDKQHPLSDQKIAELLEKDGVNVARRTIAKYREAAGIPATSLRKIHK